MTSKTTVTRRIFVAAMTALVIGSGFALTAPSAVAADLQPGASLVQTADYRGPRPDGERGHRKRGEYRDLYGPNRHHFGLSERDVRRSLRRQGYRDVRVLDRRGPVYIVRAEGWRGMRERLVVDARSGSVVDRKVLHRGGYGGHGYRGGFNWSYRW